MSKDSVTSSCSGTEAGAVVFLEVGLLTILVVGVINSFSGIEEI